MTAINKASDFKVFICYAHADNESDDPAKRWLDRLTEHLRPLAMRGQISTWSDKAIKTGDFWHESIQESLNAAKVAVLLVSPSFLASEYIQNNELPILLKKAMDRGVLILPIILRWSLYNEATFKYPHPVDGPEELPLKVFQAANPPNRPLNALKDDEQDKILLSVAQRILEVVSQNP